MDYYDFTFQKEYIGFWSLEPGTGEKMLGKLSLHEHRFEIEFYSRESRLSSFMSIPKVYGEATSNDNATILRFLVKGLHLKKGTTFFTCPRYPRIDPLTLLEN